MPVATQAVESVAGYVTGNQPPFACCTDLVYVCAIRYDSEADVDDDGTKTDDDFIDDGDEEEDNDEQGSYRSASDGEQSAEWLSDGFESFVEADPPAPPSRKSGEKDASARSKRNNAKKVGLMLCPCLTRFLADELRRASQRTSLSSSPRRTKPVKWSLPFLLFERGRPAVPGVNVDRALSPWAKALLPCMYLLLSCAFLRY